MRGFASLNHGDAAKSASDFREALKVDPKNALAHEGVANIHLSQGRFVDAKKAFDEGIALTPKQPSLYVGRALSLLDLGEKSAARTDLERVVTLDPKGEAGYTGLALTLLARLARQDGDTDKALRHLGTAIALKESDHNALVERALIYTRLGKNDLALADLEKAKTSATLDPAVATNAAYLRGKLHQQKREFLKAVESYTQAIALDPSQPVLYLDRAAAFAEFGKSSDARKDYDKAVDLDTSNSMALGQRAEYFRQTMAFDDAIRDYSTIIARRPTSHATVLARGVAYFAKGDFAKAYQDLSSVNKERNSAYSALWMVVAKSRLERGLRLSELEAYRSKEWPGPVVEIFLDHEKEDVATAVAELGHRCEALFFVGQKRLLKGDMSGARTFLQSARDMCPKSYLEYSAAGAESAKAR